MFCGCLNHTILLMAFHCLGSRGVAEMEYTYSGFCACVVILWDGHGVLKFFSSLCCTFLYYLLLAFNKMPLYPIHFFLPNSTALF